ncbi:hypothetical protein TWF506_004180, partial [Arthrobotrys conoides]
FIIFFDIVYTFVLLELVRLKTSLLIDNFKNRVVNLTLIFNIIKYHYIIFIFLVLDTLF